MNAKETLLSVSREDFLNIINSSFSYRQVALKLNLNSNSYTYKLLKEKVLNEGFETEHFITGSPSLIMQIPAADFKKIIEDGESFSDVLRKLDYKVTGGNLRTLKKRLENENLTVNHFEERRNNQFKNKMPLEEILVKDSPYKSTNALKMRLIKEGILENKCVKCGTGPEWQGEPLSLELDHIDGDNRNNLIENLRILCPNCHSQTETFGGKNIKRQKKVHHCIECNSVVFKGSKICTSCSNFKRRKQDRPSKEELLQLILHNPFTEIGRMYKVSDNTVRKWCKFYNLPFKKEEILKLKTA